MVSRDVRFEEDKAFARSLESSRADEVDAELPVAASEGAQPQWSDTDTIFRGDRVTMHSFRVTRFNMFSQMGHRLQREVRLQDHKVLQRVLRPLHLGRETLLLH